MLACVPSWWNVERGLSVNVSTEYTWDLALPHVKQQPTWETQNPLGTKSGNIFSLLSTGY